MFYRKLVFVIGLGILSAISLTHAIVKLTGNDSNTVHIALVSLLFCAYQSSIGPFFWIYIPEILKIKNICYSMAIMWFIQLVSALSFRQKGYDTFFYFGFSLCSFVSAVLISKYAVETKGVPWTIVNRLLRDSPESLMDSADYS